MKREEIFDNIKETLIYEIWVDSCEVIEEETNLRDDLGLSSLEVEDLIVSLENDYNIVFDIYDTESVNTVKDVIDLVQEKLL